MKILSVLLIALVLTAVTAGCEESTSPQPSPPPEESTSSPTRPSPGKMSTQLRLEKQRRMETEAQLRKKAQSEEHLRRSRDIWVRLTFVIGIASCFMFTGGIVIGTGARKHAQRQTSDTEEQRDADTSG